MTKTKLTVRSVKVNHDKGELFISEGSSLVVLCTGKGQNSFEFKGVVIHKGNSSYNVGTSLDTWSVSGFKPFMGSVTMEGA